MLVGVISASRPVYCQHSRGSEFKQKWQCQRVEDLKLNEVREAIMKAIAVKPGIPNTVHLTELPAPQVGDIPNGRGVLVRVLRVGVLVLSSVTAGDRKVEVPADKINLDFVLGNKVMVGTVNANREYFEMGVKDLAQAEAEYPGWLSRLLTHPVKGLENYRELFAKLTNPNGAIKVFCEVAQLT